jgi:FkbM family methyltransferase
MIAGFIYSIGRIPLLGPALRRLVRRHAEGSTTTIRFGGAAGLKWKCYSRFVSGYALGIYEPQMQEAIARELKPSQVFYDVGGNAGFFSLLAARIAGPSGKVFTFEPLPSNSDVVSEQIAVNSISNIELVKAAVGGASGKAMLKPDGAATAVLAGGNGQSAVADDAMISVDVITLDDFIKDHRKPDLMKIDVEGFEAEVLDGASAMLGPDGPVLIIEIHHDEASRRVQKTLRDAGYRLADLAGEALPTGGPDVSRPSHVVAYPARHAVTAIAGAP